MKNAEEYSNDDTVTIAEARERLGEKSPTRDAFHKAISRGKLKKLPNKAEDHDVRLRWGDILDYVASGGFKKCGPKSANASDIVTSFELDEEASTMVPALSRIVTAGADTPIDKIPAEVISVEVLPNEPDAEFPSELEDMEKLLTELATITPEDIIHRVKLYLGRAEMLAAKAVAVGSRAFNCNWACGTLLNKAKSNCQHGKFIPWLKKHFASKGISIRTCQRYMEQARELPRLTDLVNLQPGLKTSYVARGILQETAKPLEDAEEIGSGDTEQGSDHPKLAKQLLACATTFQKRFRKFTASGEVLAAGDINHLGEVMKEVSRLYEELQQQTNEKSQTAA